MFGGDFLNRALLGIPAILFALTIHEFFHGYIALRFGDTTARDMGRLTLNPLAHLDMMGVLAMIVTQFRFGWAKPVPVNPYNLRNPRRANLWISAAGPLSNFGLAIIFGFLFRIFNGGIIDIPPVVVNFLLVCVQINVTLALFNLIPLFPLDGSHILESLLPQEYGPRLAQIQRFGPYILIILLVVGGFWIIIGPFVIFFVKLFTGLY